MAIYYVKTTGSDSNSGLSEALAWRTISHALKNVPPNASHEVLIYSGTFEMENTTAGKTITSGTKFTGVGDVNSRPTIQGSFFCRTGQTNVTFENLNFSGRSDSANTNYYWKTSISFKDCSNVTVKNCKFTGAGNTAMQFERVTGILVSNVICFDCTNNPKSGPTQNTCISIGRIENAIFEGMDIDTRPRGGQGFGRSDDGTNGDVMFWRNVKWRNCKILTDRTRSAGSAPQMCIELQGGEYVNQAGSTVIRLNANAENCEIHSCFFNTMLSIAAAGSGNGTTNANREVYVHHNVFFDKDEINFHIEVLSDGIEVAYNHFIGGDNYCFYNSDSANNGVLIHHNIIELIGVERSAAPTTHLFHTIKNFPVKFFNNTVILANWAVRVFFFGAGENASNEIKNNIFYAVGNIGDQLNTTTGVSNNLFFNLTAKGSSQVTGNPLFSGTVPTALPANLNSATTPISTYSLQSGSPARNAGVQISTIGNSGQPITPGGDSAPDIGALEFGQGVFAVGLNAFVEAATPDTPTIAIASKTNNSITIAITKVGSQTVTQYGVAIKTSATGSFPADTDIAYSATPQSYAFTGLTANTTYNIQVRAKNAQGNSSYTQALTESTNADTTPAPEVPTIVIGSPTTTTIPITITKGGATNVTVWDVAYKLVGAENAANLDIAYTGNPQNYTYTGLAQNTEYVVLVRGKNGTSAGGYSAQQIVKTLAETPDVPVVELLTQFTTSNSITIRISKSGTKQVEFYDPAIKYPGQSSYENANPLIAYTGNPQEFTFNKAVPNGEHSILVRAKNGSVFSGYSTEILVTTPDTQQFFTSISNAGIKSKKAISNTIGAANAFQVIATNSLGYLDESFLHYPNKIIVGDGSSGEKSVVFKNQNEGTLAWNPSTERKLNLPDKDGTLEIVKDARLVGKDYENFRGAFSNTVPFGRFGLTITSANGGSVTGGNHKRGHSGVIRLQTNTNAAGRVALGTASDTYLIGDRYWKLFSHINPLAVATVAEAYTFFWGFAFPPASGNVPERGVYFTYSQANPNWICKTRVANVETSITTNVPVVADAFYRLEFEVNAIATQAIFKINNNIVGTSTANFPNFISDAMGVFWWLGKTNGTSNRFIDVDDYGEDWEQ